MAESAPGAGIDLHAPVCGSCFVSTYPPFSCWTRGGAASFRSALERPVDHDAPLGLYVHIPFCVKRCRYCYYLSYDSRAEEASTYLDAVIDEVARYSTRPAIAGRTPSFVYFGGGTPSLLSTGQIRKLLDGLRSSLSWDSLREATFECAPQSVSMDKLAVLREAGVTRISLGVQQLDDEVLQANGRVHLVSDVERAYDEIRAAGFPVVNLDLMVGLVGETDRSFFASLDRAVALAPESVTIYQLEIPQNTPLFRDLAHGDESAPAGWADKRERLRRAYLGLADAGYRWRSAYSAVRDPARHAFVYQDELYAGADLIGAGASSFGYLAGVHQQNVAGLGSYVEACRRAELPLGRGHLLSESERLVRSLILRLKLGRVDLDRLDEEFGSGATQRFEAPLRRFEGEGLLERDGDKIRLTWHGLARVDHMVRSFYLEEHRGVRYS